MSPTNAIKPLGPVPDKSFMGTAESVEAYNALRSYTEDCLARLRVAVGALKCEFLNTPVHCHAYDRMKEALIAIGALPEEKQGE